MATGGNQHGTVLALDEVLDATAQYAKRISGETSDSSTITGPTSADTEALRQRVVESASQLLRLTTSPSEYLEALTAQSQILACVRWLVKLNILSYIPRTGGISYIHLASIARVPLSQLRSVVRMVITSGFLSETQPNLVHHSDLSSLVAHDPSVMNWAIWLTDYSVPTAYKFSEATALWGRTSAKDQTAFSLAVDEKVPFFDYLGRNVDVAKMFSSYMRQVSLISGTDSGHLVDNFDWSRLPTGSTIVDLGGSRGHTSLTLARKNSHVKFVVQDLPEVIADAAQAIQAEDAGISSRIRFMAHNFFDPQPITDADLILLRMIIHDWPDDEAVVILSHLRDALLKPSARILVMDTVLPEPGTLPMLQERRLRVRDLTMMQVFNAKERDRGEWSELAERAGLRIVQITSPAGSAMSLIELALVDDHLPHYSLARFPSNALRNRSEFQDGLQEDHPNGRLAHSAPLGSTGRPVIIAGAGISGLCLAQALKKSGIDFKVFERDPSLDYRPQGYRLKIEADGAASLKVCLPADVYQAFEASCAITTSGQTDYDPFSASVVRSRAGSGLAGSQGLKASFTVDRSVFRANLMSGIEDKIIFNQEVKSFEHVENGDNHVLVKLSDGLEIEGTFLVGADGVRSSIRKGHIPEQRPIDTGAVCIYGKTIITADLMSRFPAQALRWMTAVRDEAPSIMSILIGDSPLTLLLEPVRFSESSRTKQDLPDDYVYWALIGRKEIFVADSARIPSSPSEAARLTLELTSEWHESIRSILELQDVQQCSALNVISAIPHIKAWQTSAHVTLIGDAIHVMSPCGGVGANTALVDAAELAEVLVTTHGAPKVADVAKFEERMRARAYKSIMRSYAGSKKMFDAQPFEACPPATL